MRMRAVRSEFPSPWINPHCERIGERGFLWNPFRNRYHLENPYWKTFDPYVIPLLAKDMDLRRFNELDTSTEVKVEQDAQLWENVKKHQS
jgi:hypothetical protein